MKMRTYGLHHAVLPLVITIATLAHGQTQWVGTWSTSPLLCEENNAIAADDLKDITLRQVVHVSIEGTRLQVRLSNRFGAVPVHFTSVHLARPASVGAGAILAASDQALSFSGQPDIIIPPGADYISDTVAYPLAPLSDLVISLHADILPAEQTGHPGSRATSFLSHGDRVSAPDIPNAKKLEHWYFISGVDVAGTPETAAVVAFGDSITDGHGATLDANNRWTDVLSQRLLASPSTRGLSVLNQGIGGNRLLLDGIGTNALARLDYDVLAQAGVKYLIVLEGVNDIGMVVHEGEISPTSHAAFVQRMIAAYGQIILRAHRHGIRVIGATILPFTGSEFYHPGPASEADRQAVNRWILAAGQFDAVIDFDALMHDPGHPERLLPAFDSGDHLHPSPAGYAAMGAAVPLSLFDGRAVRPQKMDPKR
jgi:lysophospholipase L1-like esterase